jgi:hypothetical protein
VPGTGLPPSWDDGFERDGTSVRILTRRVGRFTLLQDVQAPTIPGGFKGTVSGGQFALSWTPSTDNSALVSSYQISANGTVVKTVAGNLTSTPMGAFKTTDTRAFQVAAVDEAGHVSGKSLALRVVPKVAKLRLAAAKTALAKRTFKVGTITYKRSTRLAKGTVISAGASGLRPTGTTISLVVSRGPGQ